MNKIINKKIIDYIKKFIKDEMIFELLDSNSEIKLINFLTELFEKINIEPKIIETNLNYKNKFIDLHIEFNDETINFYME